jgi:hypothetical protein
VRDWRKVERGTGGKKERGKGEGKIKPLIVRKLNNLNIRRRWK